MAQPQLSSFASLVEWLADKMIIVGAAFATLALVSVPLGFANSLVLYIASGVMFFVAQLFIVRWMFGTGMKSTKDLGFGSNRRALKYIFFMKGLDWRLSAVAVYNLAALVILGFLGMGSVGSGALLLAFITLGTVTQAMRLNRFWPADNIE